MNDSISPTGGWFSGENKLYDIEYASNRGRKLSGLGVPFEGYLHGV